MIEIRISVEDLTESTQTEDTDILVDGLNDAMFSIGFSRSEGLVPVYVHNRGLIGDYYRAIEFALKVAATHNGPSAITCISLRTCH